MKATTKATKTTKSSKTASKKTTKQQVVRVTIFDYSATSFLKWMGGKGYNAAQAIATALSDGKNEKYRAGAASVSKEQAAKVKKLAALAN